MELKEGDVVLCTVKKIEGTTIFLHIEDDGEGSMVMSEVAAGRIRNLREYVAPNKKVVCKILKKFPDNIQLSLRRVTGTEREEVLNRYQKERTFTSMLKTSVKDLEGTIKKIKEKYALWEFFDKVKENPKLISEIFKGEEAKKIESILAEKKDKPKEAKKIIILKSDSPSGIKDIKEILNNKTVNISYLGSSQFAISSQGKDFKEANQLVDQAIKTIEVKAKEKKVLFESK